MSENDTEPESRHPLLAANRFDDLWIPNPTWRDVPEPFSVSRSDVKDIVTDTEPDVFSHGASERGEVISELAYQYRRYRTAGCSPTLSRRQGMKRTSEECEKSTSAVHNHLQVWKNEDTNVDPVIAHLESLNSRLALCQGPLSRELARPSRSLVRVLNEIATIDATPSIDPSDIRIEDALLDRPGGRRRNLVADHDVIGLPNSEERDRPASYFDPYLKTEGILQNRDGPEYFNPSARITTRDVSTYRTAYSKVLRQTFRAIQSEMTLRHKQKPHPKISDSGNDNAAIRAILPYPECIDLDVDQYFARISVCYWQSGDSSISISAHPEPGIIHDEDDPKLSGPLDSLTKPSIHAFIGATIRIAEQLN